jgi:N-acetylglutamate synthase-like GNAT family acetyltransferase
MVALMAPYIVTGDLLPRTPTDLERDLAMYAVADGGNGVVLGTGGLKPYSATLAEILALAVHPATQGQGVGRAVIEHLIRRAARLGVVEVFALTRVPGFFHRLGFTTAEKSRFPLKVWSDCAHCARRRACDEVTVHLAGVASWRPPR